MNKLRIAIVAAAAAVCLFAAPLRHAAHVSAAPADRGEVKVTTLSADNDVFEFEGLVFQPRDHVHLYLEAPTGDVYEWITASGADYVTVDSFAGFDLTVHLADDLDVVPSGTWIAHFVPEQSNEVDVTFLVQ